MAHAVEKDEFGVGNASSEIFRVFAFDDSSSVRGVVRLRPPHQLTSSTKLAKSAGVADSSA